MTDARADDGLVALWQRQNVWSEAASKAKHDIVQARARALYLNAVDLESHGAKVVPSDVLGHHKRHSGVDLHRSLVIVVPSFGRQLPVSCNS
jgi:hypothetical protein